MGNDFGCSVLGCNGTAKISGMCVAHALADAKKQNGLEPKEPTAVEPEEKPARKRKKIFCDRCGIKDYVISAGLCRQCFTKQTPILDKTNTASASCSACGTTVKKLIKGLCRPCYKKEYAAKYHIGGPLKPALDAAPVIRPVTEPQPARVKRAYNRKKPIAPVAVAPTPASKDIIATLKTKLDFHATEIREILFCLHGIKKVAGISLDIPSLADLFEKIEPL